MYILTISKNNSLIKRLSLENGLFTIGSSRLADIQVHGLHTFHYAIDVCPDYADISSLIQGHSSITSCTKQSGKQTILWNEYQIDLDCCQALVRDLIQIDSLKDGSDQALVLYTNGQRVRFEHFHNKKSIQVNISGKIVSFQKQNLTDLPKVFSISPYEIHQIALPKSNKAANLSSPIDKEGMKSIGLTALLTLTLLAPLFHFSQSNKIQDTEVIKNLSLENRTAIVLPKPKEAQKSMAQTKSPASAEGQATSITPVKTKDTASQPAANVKEILARVAQVSNSNTRKILQNKKNETDRAPALASIGPQIGASSQGPLQLKKETTQGGIQGLKDSSGGKLSQGIGSGKTKALSLSLEMSKTDISGGLDRDVVNDVIKSHLGRILYCYERQLSANPELQGKMKVRFEIAAGGTVSAQSVIEKSLHNSKVEGCVLEQISQWKFPQPSGGTKVVITYPFIFSKTGATQ